MLTCIRVYIVHISLFTMCMYNTYNLLFYQDIEKSFGKTIISGNNLVRTKIWEHVDSFTSKILKKIKAFLRANQDVIRILKGMEVANNVIFVTIDVSFLYTKIKHCEAVKWVLVILLSSLYCRPCNFWYDGQFIIFRRNIHYIQKKGVSKFSPSLANLFMSNASRTLQLLNRSLGAVGCSFFSSP